MLAAIRLHNAGIMHGKLTDAMHFVPGHDGHLRVVGFSRAITHKCEGGVPYVYEHVRKPNERPEGCGELDLLERSNALLSFPFEAERQQRWI